MKLLRHAIFLGCIMGSSLVGACSGSDPEPDDADSDANDDDDEFEGILTSQIWANFSIVATGDGMTEVTGELRVGGDKDPFIELDGEDRLLASSPGHGELSMSVLITGRRYSYVAEIPSDEDGLVVDIAFERGGVTPGAPRSSVTLPAPFTLSAVGLEEFGEWSRANDLVLAWGEPTSARMHWEFEGDCIDRVDGQTDDEGELTLSGDLFEEDILDVGESCEVFVTLSRVNTGELDPAFDGGGSIQAIQRRTFQFTSTPAVP